MSADDIDISEHTASAEKARNALPGLLDRIEKTEAELTRWKDPESAERVALQEEILFSIDEGSRSEIEQREGQLATTEAALAIVRAQSERWKQSCVSLDNQVLALRARIAELESQLAAADKTIRSWSGSVSGYAEDPARQLEIAQKRIAELDADRSKWIQAVGLLSTLAPDMLIDAADPIGMARQIEARLAAPLPEEAFKISSEMRRSAEAMRDAAREVGADATGDRWSFNDVAEGNVRVADLIERLARENERLKKELEAKRG